MVNDMIKIKGRITLRNLTTGKITVIENLVTTVGKALYMDRLINNSIDFINYYAIGNGVGIHTAASTVLFNEIFRDTVDNKSSPGNKASFEFTVLGDEALGAWTEMALNNAASVGVMTNVANVSFTHVAGEEIQVTWDITIS